jgi:hypothetical protein
MSDHQSYWLNPPPAAPYERPVLVRVERDHEWTITFGRFEESGDGTYGWVAVAPPGEWALDREASARKDFRVAYWRRPR